MYNYNQNKRMLNIETTIVLYIIIPVYICKVFIDYFNEKIVNLNKEINLLKNEVIDASNKHTYHFKEQFALYELKMDEYKDKNNSDIIAINAFVKNSMLKISNRVENALVTMSQNIETLDEHVSGFSNKLHILIMRMNSQDEMYRTLTHKELPAIRAEISDKFGSSNLDI